MTNMIDMSRIREHYDQLSIARGTDCGSFRSETARTAAAEMISEIMSSVNLPGIVIEPHVEQGSNGVYMVSGIQNRDDAEALYDAFVSKGYATPHPEGKEGFANRVVEELKLDTGSRPAVR